MTEQNTELNLGLEDIQGLIESNPELKDGLRQKLIDKEFLNQYLETDDGKAVIAPKLDSFASRAIETFKTKSMPSIIQEEISKLQPEETEEQKRLKQIEARLAQSEQEKRALEMRGVAQDALSKYGLPSNFAEFVVADSEEVTRHRAQELDMSIQELVQSQVESKVGSIANQAAAVNVDSANGTAKPAKNYYEYSVAELSEIANTNPAEFRRIQATK